jgi:peptidoglycan/xylan/chitin deacetylase (PgdA/CDA1 family)
MGDGDWHWFRYPYLREGNTLEKRNEVRAFLKERGYRVAQVTLDFWDWAFNDPYARCAAKNDQGAVAWLKETYMAQAAESLTQGQALATQIYGHDIPHVLLLHVGAFEIVMLPRLLELLEQRGFDLITLEEAQRDPAYAVDPGQLREGGSTLLHQMRDAKGLPQPPPSERPFEKVAALCR